MAAAAVVMEEGGPPDTDPDRARGGGGGGGGGVQHVPFAADSPAFRHKCDSSVRRFEQQGLFMKEFCKSVEAYQSAGLLLSRASASLANLLLDCESYVAPLGTFTVDMPDSDCSDADKGGSCSPKSRRGSSPLPWGRKSSTDTTDEVDAAEMDGEDAEESLMGPEVSRSLVQMGRLMQEVSDAHSMCMESLTQALIMPLEDFVADEMAEISAARKEYSSSAEHHMSARRKFLQGGLKMKSATVLQDALRSRVANLAVETCVAEGARFNFARKLSYLQAKMPLVIRDGILASVASLSTLYRQCSDAVDTHKPEWVLLQKEQLTGARQLDASGKQWDSQESLLRAAVALTPETLEVAQGGKKENSASVCSPPPPARGRAGSVKELKGGGGFDAIVNCSILAAEELYGAMRMVRALAAHVYSPPVKASSHMREGWLFKKSSRNMMSGWRRRWFTLDGTRLSYLHRSSSGRFQAVRVCDVLLASVKEVQSVETLYCFEIYCANKKSYVLQAECAEDLEDWLADIKKCISDRLAGQYPHGIVTATNLLSEARVALREKGDKITSPSHGDSMGRESTGDTDGRNSGSRPSSLEAANPHLLELLRTNPACADCGAIGPEWVSVNLGVLICIECSGIHRSLGTHISKVRSLALDALNSDDLALVSDVGNDVSNSIWEACPQAGWVKPTASSPMEDKRGWIKAKYAFRGFLDIEGWDHELDLCDGEIKHKDKVSAASRKLCDAVKDNSLVGALRALAHEADPNWVDPRTDALWSAMHQAAHRGSVKMCAMLYLNGADLTLRDEHGCQPLDIAVFNSKMEAINFLRQKMLESGV